MRKHFHLFSGSEYIAEKKFIHGDQGVASFPFKRRTLAMKTAPQNRGRRGDRYAWKKGKKSDLPFGERE